MSVACVIITLVGGGMAVGQLYKSKDSDVTAVSVAITADSHTLAPTPAPTVAAENGSSNNTEKPVKYTLKYNGINITGNSTEFIKDVLLPLMYIETVAPEYYPKCTTDIVEENKITGMAALFGQTSINSTEIKQNKEWIYNNGDRGIDGLDGIGSMIAGHEDQHSCDGPYRVSNESANKTFQVIFEKLKSAPTAEKEKDEEELNKLREESAGNKSNRVLEKLKTVPLAEKKKYLSEFEEEYKKIESQITTI